MFNEMFSAESLQRVIIYAVPMLLGIICHEVAHGYVAWRLGDPTAKSLGRLTLNPVRHIDPTGLLVFVITALAAPFTIGWAKPVPVNPRYFKKPSSGMALVSAAGPLTNFALALCFAIIMFSISKIPSLMLYVFQELPILWKILQAGVWINLLLGWFNLMPIPPMDGSQILSSFLPSSVAEQYMKIGRYGMLLIILLLVTGLFWKVLGPMLYGSLNLIINTLNIPFIVDWM